MTMNKACNNTKCIEVLIVDDHPLVRSGLAQLISDESDMTVCGEAETVSEAVTKLDSELPDIAVIDLSLGRDSGIDLLRWLSDNAHPTRPIVLSMHQESLYATRALQAGALAYINKRSANREIVTAIREVSKGKTYLSTDMVEKITERIGKRGAVTLPGAISSLSDRELEVFRLIADGQETRQIADTLHLSSRTIDTHKERIKLKLGLDSTTELVRRATLWAAEGYSE